MSVKINNDAATVYSTNTGYLTDVSSSDEFSHGVSFEKDPEPTTVSAITLFYFQGVEPFVPEESSPTQSSSIFEQRDVQEIATVQETSPLSIIIAVQETSPQSTTSEPVNLNSESTEQPTCFSQFLSTLRKILLSFLIWSDKMNPFVYNRN